MKHGKKKKKKKEKKVNGKNIIKKKKKEKLTYLARRFPPRGSWLGRELPCARVVGWAGIIGPWFLSDRSDGKIPAADHHDHCGAAAGTPQACSARVKATAL